MYKSVISSLDGDDPKQDMCERDYIVVGVVLIYVKIDLCNNI